jgi:adenosylcobinamide-phosphate synthase (EC 6.3.1.10)
MYLSHRSQTLLIALIADALLGDPPNAWHPVALMGRWMHLGERFAPQGATARLLWGGMWLTAGAAATGSVVALLPDHPVVRGLAASTLMAYRGLDRAVGEVQTALERGDLAEARRLLGWHLVSRPTADLRADEVAGAAIESLAENLSDSLVAPALALLVGGLPAIAVYRLSNTADAMWGYRNERYEYLGKTAARLDDALNLLPARLTAALIAAAAQIVCGRGMIAWQIARRDARAYCVAECRVAYGGDGGGARHDPYQTRTLHPWKRFPPARRCHDRRGAPDCARRAAAAGGRRSAGNVER